jgi:predicted LPLAT superfamily acyltransferase
MKKNHWADLGESTFVAGIWFLYGVYCLFGRLPFRFFLYPVVSYYWLTRPVARRSSLEYLQRLQESRHVFGKPSGLWQGYKHFIQFGETLLDKLLAIGGNYPVENVCLSGHDIIWTDLEKRTGCLIITAHLGCLELMQCVSSLERKFKINILVHTAHATSFNRILDRINPHSGVNFLQVTAFNAPTAMMLADRIAAGEVIAIAGDRVPTSGDRIVRVPFLGKLAPFPAGPYLIASLLACPAYAMACMRKGTGYELQVEKLADAVATPRNKRNELIEQQAAKYAAWLEHRVAESPFDWFNFFPFWDQAVRDEK